MTGQAGFWDLENSLEALLAEGDLLKNLDRPVSFEEFHPLLSKAVLRSDLSKGGLRSSMWF